MPLKESQDLRVFSVDGDHHINESLHDEGRPRASDKIKENFY